MMLSIMIQDFQAVTVVNKFQRVFINHDVSQAYIIIDIACFVNLLQLFEDLDAHLYNKLVTQFHFLIFNQDVQCLCEFELGHYHIMPFLCIFISEAYLALDVEIFFLYLHCAIDLKSKQEAMRGYFSEHAFFRGVGKAFLNVSQRLAFLGCSTIIFKFKLYNQLLIWIFHV